MAGPIQRDDPGEVNDRARLLFGGLAVANVAAWSWAWANFHARPDLLAAAALAYVFGLRHAVDADHIAAIDNVTRRMVHDGKRPLGVGLFFSLGHSTVVAIACLMLAVATSTLKPRLATLHALGGLIGASISALFLIVIALTNLSALVSLHRMMRLVRRGGAIEAGELDTVLSQRGLLGRILGQAVKLMSSSWRMYPLGFLFGLGFDTATEIGLLAIAASNSAGALPVGAVMAFPALFAAGMSSVDSLDSVLMLKAYSWAATDPMRKLRYNFAVTLLSVVAALAVGGIEVVGLLGQHLGLKGPGWQLVDALSAHFGLIGAAIVAACLGTWLVGLAAYRRRNG